MLPSKMLQPPGQDLFQADSEQWQKSEALRSMEKASVEGQAAPSCQPQRCLSSGVLYRCCQALQRHTCQPSSEEPLGSWGIRLACTHSHLYRGVNIYTLNPRASPFHILEARVPDWLFSF